MRLKRAISVRVTVLDNALESSIKSSMTEENISTYQVIRKDRAILGVKYTHVMFYCGHSGRAKKLFITNCFNSAKT